MKPWLASLGSSITIGQVNITLDDIYTCITIADLLQHPANFNAHASTDTTWLDWGVPKALPFQCKPLI